jgi:hypothetical protein
MGCCCTNCKILTQLTSALLVGCIEHLYHLGFVRICQIPLCDGVRWCSFDTKWLGTSCHIVYWTVKQCHLLSCTHYTSLPVTDTTS